MNKNHEGLNPRSVLYRAGVRPLLVARFSGSVAAQMLAVVVGWQIYAISHSTLALGWVGLAQFIPMALAVLPAGDLADRLNRRRLLAAAALVQALACGLLLLLSLGQPARLLFFYAVLALFGVARAFAGPAMQSYLPLLVPPGELSRVIVWNSSIFQVAVIGGPALGGAAYLLGPVVAYGICMALFLVAAALVATIRAGRRQRRDPRHRAAFERFTAGIAYVRRNPVILGAISLDLFAVLFGGSTALLPVFASDILHVGPLGLGALRSAGAVGALFMGLYLGRHPLRHGAGRIMFACVALFGLATLVFGLSRSFTLSMVMLAIAGGADMVSVLIRLTLVQMATPDEMRGRVSAVNALFVGSSNELGEFESGLTAHWFGTVPAVVLGGIGTLAVVAIWAWRFPALRHVDRFDDVRPA